MLVKDRNPKIHPTAIVHPGAVLGEAVEVGPYSVIGEHVTIGSGCWIGTHCVLEGHTTIGQNNRFFTGAVIGSIPQDLKYKGEPTLLTIGNHNTFREYVTVNLGTKEGGGETRIGSHVLMMAYSHVAHDCHVHDHAILSNVATLAGHVIVEEGAVLGGLGGVHQFARVGKLAILGACSKAVQDVVPFAIADGQRACVYGLNKIGLERVGIPKKTQQDLERAFRILFHSGCSTKSALEKIEKELPKSQELSHLTQFIRTSKRGFCRGVGKTSKDEPSWND